MLCNCSSLLHLAPLPPPAADVSSSTCRLLPLLFLPACSLSSFSPISHSCSVVFSAFFSFHSTLIYFCTFVFFCWCFFSSQTVYRVYFSSFFFSSFILLLIYGVYFFLLFFSDSLSSFFLLLLVFFFQVSLLILLPCSLSSFTLAVSACFLSSVSPSLYLPSPSSSSSSS